MASIREIIMDAIRAPEPRPWRTLITAPHMTLAGAIRATTGWAEHAESALAKNAATELRLTIGQDGIGVFFNEVEVR